MFKGRFYQRPKKEKKQEDDFLEGVKIKIKKPPIYKAVCRAFGLYKPSACFTYGDTIYNPEGFNIPEEMIEHEKVHMEQQKVIKPALWWGKFLREPEFRLDQESKGYARQYDVVCERVKDRNDRNRYLFSYANSLAGPLYGNCTNTSEAMKLILSHSKNKR